MHKEMDTLLLFLAAVPQKGETEFSYSWLEDEVRHAFVFAYREGDYIVLERTTNKGGEVAEIEVFRSFELRHSASEFVQRSTSRMLRDSEDD